jgi:hypothetical protein
MQTDALLDYVGLIGPKRDLVLDKNRGGWTSGAWEEPRSGATVYLPRLNDRRTGRDKAVVVKRYHGQDQGTYAQMAGRWHRLNARLKYIQVWYSALERKVHSHRHG